MKRLLEKIKSKTLLRKPVIVLDWLPQLDAMEELAALEHTTKFLAEFVTPAGVTSVQVLEALLRIDDSNHARMVKLQQQLFKFDHMRTDLQIRLHEVLYFYQRQLYLGYTRILMDTSVETDALDYSDSEPHLALARAMHMAFNMIKLRYLNHQPCPNAIWLQIYQLYRIGEQQALLDLSVHIYNEPVPTTLNSLFVQGCMLDTAYKCAANRQQLETISSLIINLVPGYTTSERYNAGKHVFQVDMQLDKGPQRIRQQHLNEHCRFWDSDELSLKVELLIHAIKHKLPLNSFNIDQLTEQAGFSVLLAQLQGVWSRTQYQRQRRREERIAVERQAVVCSGLADVTNQLKQMQKRQPSSKSFEERLSAHTVVNQSTNTITLFAKQNSWTILNESVHGLGAEVNQEQAMQVKPDRLVGMTLNDARDEFLLGMVKNVLELGASKRQVGIAIISRHVVLVDIVPKPVAGTSGNESLENVSRLGSAALYLPAEASINAQACIILPRINFIEHSQYQVTSADRKVLLQLGKILESKDDWARVSIENAL